MRKILFSLTLSLSIFTIIGIGAKAAGTNMDNATPIKLNDTFSGTLAPGATDFYKFELPTSGKVTFTHKKEADYSGSYTFTEIINTDGHNSTGTFWSDPYDSNRGYIYGTDYTYLSKGVYYLKTSHTSGNYSYNVVFESTGETFTESESAPLEYMDNAPTISLGETITGQLGGFDNQDFFKFTLPRSSTITINHTKNMEHYNNVQFYLLDADGSSIDYLGNDSDYPDTEYFKGTYEKNLSAGTYFIKIVRGNKGGKYTFSVNEKPVEISRATIKSVKRNGKKTTVKIKKVTEATGYEVVYSLSKSFPAGKTKVVNTSKTSVVLKKLKKNKPYYVKVRAYKIESGYKYYGDYSSVKKIKKK
ncbi:pre-peptidase C-terminal domain-containing protein [Butyrivibrio sp. ob235]|uniref:pre-peptidase C-terminal domain-containing protein n=1 Tax=Butyrivibrio sp. ob235 TaxID=1761780 RepID=UPI0008B088B2|nr:pre-peptidase C-terminal domain-containing protein [Butyrivibrio sp. ob235]SEK70946.1 pre-peptidase C-terminal domain-containing protein [Butyrivibrio sp. ob235]